MLLEDANGERLPLRIIVHTREDFKERCDGPDLAIVLERDRFGHACFGNLTRCLIHDECFLRLDGAERERVFLVLHHRVVVQRQGGGAESANGEGR